MSIFRKSWAVIKVGFKTALAYRLNFIAELLTAPIALIVYYFVWKSIFEYSGETVINGFTFHMMISYYVLQMIVSFFTWSDVEKWMEEDIVNGELVFDLLKPFKYVYNQLSFEMGLNLLTLAVEAIPLLLISILVFSVQAPSKINIVLFSVSLLLAFLMYYLMSFIIGIMALKLTRIDALHTAKKTVISFLSGGILPLTFFPVWAQSASKYLPFQYVRYVPINIYLGTYTITESLTMLGIQLAWVIGLLVVVNYSWHFALKHFTGVGV